MPNSPRLQHSPSGYVAALLMRSASTILVEGADDKSAVDRVLLELSEEKGGAHHRIVVDTAQIIASSGEVMGNREKVEAVHSLAISKGARLACLVDREFREFEISSTIKDNLACHFVKDKTLFWTRGHSLENYFFHFESVYHFLKFMFADRLPANCELLLQQAMPTIITWSAALSVAAYCTGTCKLMRGIVTPQHWLVDQNPPRLDLQKIETDLRGRSVADAVTEQYRLSALEAFAKLEKGDIGLHRWISHGHIGAEVIWTGVAAILSTCVTDERLIESIARGHNDLKLRQGADLWAKDICSGKAEAPYELWKWAGFCQKD